MLRVLLQFFRWSSDAARALLFLDIQGPGKLQLLYLWFVQRICKTAGCFDGTHHGRSTGNGANADSVLSVLPPVPPQTVVWASIDPVHGNLQVYPLDAALRIEQARCRGDFSVELNHFHACVHFDAEGLGKHLQRTAGGRRDVCRLSSRSEDGHVAVSVHRPGRAWRLLNEDEPVVPTPPPGVEIRTADPGRDAFHVTEAEISTPASEQAPVPYDPANDTGVVGRLPLWVWCRENGVCPLASQQLPATAWGVYSREQNSAIEDAFQAGEEDVSVSVGIRTYRIVFSPEAGFARQVDDALHKRRQVRRRLLDSSEERDEMLEPAAPQIAREQESCPICFMDFAETPTMPVLELPGCRHVFHMACAQQLADSRSQCPCCRGEVDWDVLGATDMGRRLP